jgi:hypothetical protein
MNLPTILLAQVDAGTLDPDNLEAVLSLVGEAVMKGQWGVVASVLIAALIAGLRKYIPETTGFGKVIRTKVGAIVTNFLLSAAVTTAALLTSGTVISWNFVLKVLTVAFAAAGGWSIVKALVEVVTGNKDAPAQEAGKAAAEDPKPTLDA